MDADSRSVPGLKIDRATAEYEAWISRHLRLLGPDLVLKHQQMRSAPFPFLRATFYRWAQVWASICPEAARAPVVLAVGDLHVQNFGTWRDSEGRLIWGTNDFDEADTMPYTVDLVRLAASTHLAINAGPLNIDHREACQSILSGYKESLEAGG